MLSDWIKRVEIAVEWTRQSTKQVSAPEPPPPHLVQDQELLFDGQPRRGRHVAALGQVRFDLSLQLVRVRHHVLAAGRGAVHLEAVAHSPR